MKSVYVYNPSNCLKKRRQKRQSISGFPYENKLPLSMLFNGSGYSGMKTL